MATPTPATSTVAEPRMPYKAAVAFLITLLGTLWAALEGKDNLANMTVMEWASVIIPVILATAGVYGVRNPKVTV